MIRYADVFRDSCKRVTEKETAEGKGFFDVFYDKFIGSSPVVAEKFRNVDMASQKEMLEQSLACLLELFATKQIPARLREIARKHDRRHVDVAPELYDLWLRCLLATVEEFDSDCCEDVELAWRLVCSQGIAYMAFMYDK